MLLINHAMLQSAISGFTGKNLEISGHHLPHEASGVELSIIIPEEDFHESLVLESNMKSHKLI